MLVDPLPIAVVIPAHNAERFLKDALALLSYFPAPIRRVARTIRHLLP
jgi:hypothetical protein